MPIRPGRANRGGCIEGRPRRFKCRRIGGQDDRRAVVPGPRYNPQPADRDAPGRDGAIGAPAQQGGGQAVDGRSGKTHRGQARHHVARRQASSRLAAGAAAAPAAGGAGRLVAAGGIHGQADQAGGAAATGRRGQGRYRRPARRAVGPGHGDAARDHHRADADQRPAALHRLPGGPDRAQGRLPRPDRSAPVSGSAGAGAGHARPRHRPAAAGAFRPRPLHDADQAAQHRPAAGGRPAVPGGAGPGGGAGGPRHRRQREGQPRLLPHHGTGDRARRAAAGRSRQLRADLEQHRARGADPAAADLGDLRAAGGRRGRGVAAAARRPDAAGRGL